MLPWLSHLFYLDGLRSVGATFLLNDLAKEEWDGLIMLEAVRLEIEREQLRKEEQKQKIKEVMEKSKMRR